MKFNLHLCLLGLMTALALTACEPVRNVEDKVTASATDTAPVDVSEADKALSKLLASIADHHLLPGYQKLDQSLLKLNRYLQKSCDDNQLNDDEMIQLRNNWKQSMQNWQSVNWFAQGPVDTHNRHSRIQYWPDGNRAVKRGVEKLLAGETPSVQELANLNVGAQGLPALESLLFGETASIAAAKHCATMLVITENLTQITTEILNEWQVANGFREEFIAGKGSFTSIKDAVEETFSNWFAQFIVIKDNKISYPMGFKAPGIPALAESPISDTSSANLRANLAATKKLLSGDNDFNLLTLLHKSNAGELAGRIEQQINLIDSQVNKLPDSFSAALSDEVARAELLELNSNIGKLQSLLVVEMTGVLKLNIGFNAMDGD